MDVDLLMIMVSKYKYGEQALNGKVVFALYKCILKFLFPTMYRAEQLPSLQPFVHVLS